MTFPTPDSPNPVKTSSHSYPFSEDDYPFLTIDEKFIYWIQEIAANSRIWGIPLSRQFTKEFYVSLTDAEPLASEENVRQLIEMFSLYYEIDRNILEKMMRFSFEQPQHEQQRKKLDAMDDNEHFLVQVYPTLESRQRLEFWRLEFAYDILCRGWHPYVSIHSQWKSRLEKYEGENYLLMFEKICTLFQLDYNFARKLLELDEDSDEHERLTDPFLDEE